MGDQMPQIQEIKRRNLELSREEQGNQKSDERKENMRGRPYLIHDCVHAV